MPIWAPRGGRPGLAISGHSTGAWSEVIRHTDTGAGAGDQPAAGPAAAAAGHRLEQPRLRARRGSAAGTVGRSWPKSASSRPTPRPRRSCAAAVHCVGLSGAGPMPERDGGGGEAGVLGEVEPQRGEPGAADGRVEAASELGDPQRSRGR